MRPVKVSYPLSHGKTSIQEYSTLLKMASVLKKGVSFDSILPLVKQGFLVSSGHRPGHTPEEAIKAKGSTTPASKLLRVSRAGPVPGEDQSSGDHPSTGRI